MFKNCNIVTLLEYRCFNMFHMINKRALVEV